MIFADLFAEISPGFMGYADEVFVICCILLVFPRILQGKVKFWKYYTILVGVVVIGMLGNMVWGIQSEITVVLMDLFLFIKPYMVLICLHLILTERRAAEVYYYAMVVSKVLLIIMAIFSVVTLIVPLGMRITESGTFQFLSGFSGVPSWWAILFLGVISSNPQNKRTFYFVLSSIIVLQSKSGLGSLALILAIWLYFFGEKQKKFKWYHLMLVAPLCLWVGRNEISEYLMNANAPRFLLFYYALITANRFFPLGAGFATYGSSMAIANYSQLYYEYGFQKRWGMSKTYHPFLMDSYFPQILGQFGYIGFIFYTIFIFMLFRKLIFRIHDKNLKCSCLYLFLCWFVAGFGFGTASFWGCTIYALISVFLFVDKKLKNEENEC